MPGPGKTGQGQVAGDVLVERPERPVGELPSGGA